MEMKKIIVFCRHFADVNGYFKELVETMKPELMDKTRKTFQTEYECYEFVSINSYTLDGLSCHEFLLSPRLLKSGKKEQIDLAIKLGRSYAAIYP